MSPELILGLDISTSVIGCCIIDTTGKLYSLFNIKFSKIKNEGDGLFQKVKILQEKLEEYEHLIKYVAIENYLVRFSEGYSSAQVIALLANFNGMCSATSFHLYKVTPVLYNVNTARKLAFPFLKFPKGSDRKELVRQSVAVLWPEVEWPVMTKGKNVGGFRKECYDMSDAAVVALARMRELNHV